MRQVLAMVAAVVVAGIGAVILGEYQLVGTTAVIGFPLFGVAVSELTLVIAKRLAPVTLAASALSVAGGLIWALWISFAHFSNNLRPPTLSWIMVAVAVVANVAWGWSGRRRGDKARDTGRSQPVDKAPIA